MPRGGEEGGGWCHSRRLVGASLLLSLFSFVLSLLLNVIVLTMPANTQFLVWLEDLEDELNLLIKNYIFCKASQCRSVGEAEVFRRRGSLTFLIFFYFSGYNG